MSKFTAKISFGSNITADQAREWAATVQDQLPEGADLSITQDPLVLNIEDLAEEHIGEKVSLFVSNRIGEVTGTLEGVFIAGRGDDSPARTVVVDGHAYTMTYGTVQLGEW